MSLYHYLVRLETVLRSRQDINIELLQVDVITIGVKFKCELRFYDGSRLSVVEELVTTEKQDFDRVNYKFHYQNMTGNLVFRYDNAPHYPDLPTFPAHKHIGDAVFDAESPDLNEVLAEIDTLPP